MLGQQQTEQRPLPRAPQRQEFAVPADLQRPEHPKP